MVSQTALARRPPVLATKRRFPSSCAWRHSKIARTVRRTMPGLSRAARGSALASYFLRCMGPLVCA